jgi:hypothetical protein
MSHSRVPRSQAVQSLRLSPYSQFEYNSRLEAIKEEDERISPETNVTVTQYKKIITMAQKTLETASRQIAELQRNRSSARNPEESINKLQTILERTISRIERNDDRITSVQRESIARRRQSVIPHKSRSPSSPRAGAGGPSSPRARGTSSRSPM